MNVNVQIRDVPQDVHRTLKARAAMAGVSLSEYLRELMATDAARPSPAELWVRIDARGSAPAEEPSEVSIRRLRDHGE